MEQADQEWLVKKTCDWAEADLSEVTHWEIAWDALNDQYHVEVYLQFEDDPIKRTWTYFDFVQEKSLV